MKISVVIQTLNSGNILRECLESVKSFDEIVVCDMYSEDNTLDIAKEYNCKIVMHDRCNGIVEPARDFAIQSASNEWILIVDSDELVSTGLKDYLYSFIQLTENFSSALLIPRKNFFMNKYMHCDFPDYQLRFIKKEKYIHWPVTIHARPDIEGNVEKVPAKESLALIHLDKNRIGNILNKMARYSDREVEKRKKKKENFATLLFKPFFLFIKFYIFRRGFIDGKEGFIYCKLKSLSKSLIIARVIERKELGDFY